MKKLMLGLLFLLVAAGAGGQNVKKFTVLQWNVWQEGTVVPGGYEDIVNEIARLEPGFVTFREVRH